MTSDNDIKKNVLSKIRSGELHMRSSAYFAWRVALLALVVILALIVSVMIFNYIFFSIRLSDEGELFALGPRGIVFFFEAFPWTFLGIDIALIALAEYLLRYFRFGYRNPVAVLLVGLVLLSVILGLLIDRTTPFNDRMFEHAHEHRWGLIDAAYEHAHRPPPPGGAVCRCVIESIGTSTIRAYSAEASSTPLTLYLPPGFATSSLSVGEVVYIAGDRDGNTVRVFGLRMKMPPPVR